MNVVTSKVLGDDCKPTVTLTVMSIPSSAVVDVELVDVTGPGIGAVVAGVGGGVPTCQHDRCQSTSFFTEFKHPVI